MQQLKVILALELILQVVLQVVLTLLAQPHEFVVVAAAGCFSLRHFREVLPDLLPDCLQLVRLVCPLRQVLQQVGVFESAHFDFVADVSLVLPLQFLLAGGGVVVDEMVNDGIDIRTQHVLLVLL